MPKFASETIDTHRATQAKEKAYLLGLGTGWANPEAMFTTVRGHYLDPDNASKLFKSLASRVGLGNWHIHELRHSTASLMLAQGVRLEEVSKLIGHSSIRITADTYGHLQPERLRSATEVFGGYLSGLTE